MVEQRSMRALIEALGPITLVTGTSYAIGYSYYQGFLRTLSIPRRFTELSTTLYIIESYRAIGIFVFYVGIAIAIAATFSHNKMTPRHTNIFFAIPLVMMIFQEIRLGFSLFTVLFTLYCLVLVVCSPLSVYTYMTTADIPIRLMFGLSFLALLIIYSTEQGEQDAIEIIEGRAGARAVRLELTTDPLGLNGREFILPMMHDDTYYLVERQRPASENPIVYIVPENQVKVATVRRLDGDSESPVILVETPVASPAK